MLKLKGYIITETLYESQKTIVYRGKRESDNRSIVVKILKAKRPTRLENDLIEREYRIAKNLAIPGIIKPYALSTVNHKKLIIVEDFGGISLNKYIDSHKPDLTEILLLGKSIVEILGTIHKKGVIHKDIKPHNILINPETNELKIIDFSIAAEVQREIKGALSPNIIEGTLAYISPEQTGRMNRSIDFRSDFYSLGVTLYELLTGKLPFTTKDQMQLVHSHIAIKPVPPVEVNPDIPKTVSDIVMKLLAKTAEDRYQGTIGLYSDLEKSYIQLTETGKINNFIIGSQDISERFQIPEKLYGREKEIDHLMRIFDRISMGTKEMVFYSGVSGIGKSALINEIQRPLVEKQGYFISGKYDQFKRNIPYSAIIHAFQELVKHLLTESEELLAIWKNNILKAVGNNGQVIIDVIPDIGLIIGKQPEIQPLAPAEAQNRFNLVFQNFIRIFATKDHPLILFLDDLQWADNASLQLLNVLLSDTALNYLLFIGAYRNNEVDSHHPLLMMIKKMKQEGIKWEDIKMTPLSEDNIEQLILDTLHCGTAKTKEFSRLIHSKTNGNPFFVTEFFKTLYHYSLIEFKDGWTWDLTRIKQTGITDNVVELMADKISKLPVDTLDVLKTAAVIGDSFDMETLSQVYGQNTNETFNKLTKTINEGMIIPVENKYKFVHDKVQEAAYSLLDQNERKLLHYRIGNIILAEAKKQNVVDEQIFKIVNQLNLARDLFTEKDINEMCQLNFKAGQKAKFSNAYDAAVEFLRYSESLVKKESWDSDYDSSLSLYTELAEVEYLVRNYERAGTLFNIVLHNAKTLFDKIKIYSIQIDHYTNQLKHKDGLEIGLQALKQLGFSLPKNPGQLAILPELIKVKRKLSQRKTDDLLNLPEMKDPRIIAAIKIMYKLLPSAYNTNLNLFTILALKMAALSSKYGNTAESSMGYITFGAIMLGVLDDIENGNEFVNLAVELADKFRVTILQGNIYWVYGTGTHYTKFIRESMNYLEKGMQYSFEAGDFQFIGFSYASYHQAFFLSGEKLTLIKEYADIYTPNVHKLKQPQIQLFFMIGKQIVLNLLGDSKETILLKGEAFDEELTIPEFFAANDITGLAYYFGYSLILTYIFQDYLEGLEKCKNEKIVHDGLLGQPLVQVFYFYQALTLSAILLDPKLKGKRKYLKKIKKIRKKFEKLAEHCQENYLHKYKLISAELSRIKGKNSEAALYYNEAIRGASENRFYSEEAIANERAAHFYLAQDNQEKASAYMSEAYYCYLNWGAGPKAENILRNYDSLVKIENRSCKLSTITATETSTAISTTTDLLDITTVMKATQTISSEIEMEKLLQKLIKIVIENAGAQKASLILLSNGELLIEAEGEIDGAECLVMKSVPINASQKLSPAIIRYVAKTCKNLVLNNATNEDLFNSDPYIIENKPKSILCQPILHHGKLIGILYLENNLSTGAFTPNRLQVLKILSSQAAISIENARFYTRLEDSEKKYRGIFEKTTSGIIQTTPNGRLLTANPALAQILGYDSQNDLAQNITDISKQIFVDPTKRLEFLAEMNANDLVNNFEFECYRKDGTSIMASINSRAIRDENQQLLYFEGILEDITQKKHLEEYKIAKEVAEESNRAKSEFLANMSHEIRTPLNAVTGFSELLASTVSDTRQKSYLDAIKTAGKNLLSLINDILDLSKIEAKKLDIQYSYLDPKAIIREIEQIFKLKVTNKNLQFIIDIAEDLPVALLLDETRLRQILLNLVSNAVKFTEKGCISILAKCNYKTDSPNKIDLIVSVQDTGIGIPIKDQENIFDAFQQQSGQSVSKYGGTGLGLTISKRLIEMMNGKITLHSAVNKGTTFEIILKDVEVSDKEILVIEEKSFDLENIAFESGKVLIVDDIESNRFLLSELLNKVNLNVLAAENGQQTLLLAEEYQPNIIIMDIRMPVMDGIEAVKQLKLNPKTKKIPVIAISASSKSTDISQLAEIGFSAYLPKPINISKLFFELSNYLNSTHNKGLNNGMFKFPLGEIIKKSSDKKQSEQLPPETLLRLPELIEILESQFMKKWAEFQDKLPMRELKKFGYDLNEIACNYKIELLIEFARNWISYVENFDIESILKALKEFPEVIERLKSIESINRTW